eukprot:PhM_4_TR11965/c0_g1_i1/m.30991
MDDVCNIILQQDHKHLNELFAVHEEDGGQPMSEDDFVSTFLPLVQSRRPTATDSVARLQHLYMSVDTYGRGSITWDDFSSYLLLQSARLEDNEPTDVPRDFQSSPTHTPDDVNIKAVLHREAIHSVIAVPRPHRIVTASTDGTVKLWKVATGMHERTIHNSKVKVTCCTYASEINSLIVTCLDRTIFFYDAGSGDLSRAFRTGLKELEQPKSRRRRRRTRTRSFSSPNGTLGGSIAGGDGAQQQNPSMESGVAAGGASTTHRESIRDDRETMRHTNAQELTWERMGLGKKHHFVVPIHAVDTELGKRSLHPSLENTQTVPAILSHFERYDLVRFMTLTELGYKVDSMGRVRHLGSVTAVIVVPPSGEMQGPTRLFVGLQSGHVQVYNLPSVHSFGDMAIPCQRLIFAHRGAVNCILNISRVGQIGTGGNDGLIKLWRFDTLEKEKTLGKGIINTPANLLTESSFERPDPLKHGHTRPVTHLIWCESKKLLISAAREPQILLWNPVIEHALARLDEHTAPIVNVVLNVHDHQLVTLAQNSVLKVWDVRSYKCVQTLEHRDFSPLEEGQALTAMTFDAKRGALVVANRTVHTWPMARSLGSYPANYVGHRTPIVASRFSGKFNQLVTASQDLVLVWDLASPSPAQRLEMHDEQINDIEFDLSQRLLLIASRNGTTYVYNYLSFKLMRRLNPLPPPAKGHPVPEVGCVLCCHLEKPKPVEYVITSNGNQLLFYAMNQTKPDVPTTVTSSTSSYLEPIRVIELGPQRTVYAMWHVEPGLLLLGCNDGLGYLTLTDMSENVVMLSRAAESEDALVSVQRGPIHFEPAEDVRRCLGLVEQRNDTNRVKETAERLERTFRTLQEAPLRVRKGKGMVGVGPSNVADDVNRLVVECVVVLRRVQGLVITGEGSGVIRFWDLSFGCDVLDFRSSYVSGDAVFSVAVNADETMLFTGDVNGYVTAYDISDIPTADGNRSTALDIFPGSIRRRWCVLAHESSITTLHVLPTTAPVAAGDIICGSTDTYVSIYHTSGVKSHILGAMSAHNHLEATQTLAASRVLDMYRAEAIVHLLDDRAEADFHTLETTLETHPLFSHDAVLDVNRASCILRLLDALMSSFPDVQPLVKKNRNKYYPNNAVSSEQTRRSTRELGASFRMSTQAGGSTPSVSPVAARTLTNRHPVDIKLPLILKPHRKRADVSKAVASLLAFRDDDDEVGSQKSPDGAPLRPPSEGVAHNMYNFMHVETAPRSGSNMPDFQYERTRRFFAHSYFKPNPFVPPRAPHQRSLDRTARKLPKHENVSYVRDPVKAAGTWSWGASVVTDPAPDPETPRAPGTRRVSSNPTPRSQDLVAVPTDDSEGPIGLASCAASSFSKQSTTSGQAEFGLLVPDNAGLHGVQLTSFADLIPSAGSPMIPRPPSDVNMLHRDHLRRGGPKFTLAPQSRRFYALSGPDTPEPTATQPPSTSAVTSPPMTELDDMPTSSCVFTLPDSDTQQQPHHLNGNTPAAISNASSPIISALQPNELAAVSLASDVGAFSVSQAMSSSTPGALATTPSPQLALVPIPPNNGLKPTITVSGGASPTEKDVREFVYRYIKTHTPAKFDFPTFPDAMKDGPGEGGIAGRARRGSTVGSTLPDKGVGIRATGKKKLAKKATYVDIKDD